MECASVVAVAVAMTNEEFTGHLLATLHGPKADEVARIVFERVVEGMKQPETMAALAPGVADVVVALADALGLDDLMQMVQALTMLAMATTQTDRRVGVSPQDGMRRISARIACAKVVKDHGREMYIEPFDLSEVDGGEFMARLFED